MDGSIEARVTAALAQIQNPRLENDLLSAGMIRDLTVTDEGRVTFTFLLAPEDPATLVRSARARGRGGRGSAEGRDQDQRGQPGRPPARTLTSQSAAPGRNHRLLQPPWTSRPGQDHRRLLGQGGSRQIHGCREPGRRARAEWIPGRSVMDADVYGPNIPRMFGVFDRPAVLRRKDPAARGAMASS